MARATDSTPSTSLTALAAAVRSGATSAEALTEHALERIRALDGELGAFLHVAADAARAEARALDARRRRGETLGPLAGVPIALKDALCTHDQPTTAGSRILVQRRPDGSEHPWQPPYDATVVARLRAADAVLIGKTNLDELAMGSSTENSAFRPTKNPWDTTRIPGGSSGGSAVAVAAGMALGALGSDTGGSVRQPAALTHVVGVKPSYGRVSRYGLIAFASSLDQVGPFAADVRGAAALTAVVAGHDPRDATSLEAPVPDYLAACERGVAGLRIGVPEEYFAAGLDPEVEENVRAALAALAAQGAVLRPVHLPHTRHAVATYYVIATAEASSNLARFDGVRFGLRAGERAELGRMYERTRGAGFGREVKRRIMLGTYVLSAGYYEAYYLRAQRVRALIKRDFDAAFAEVDLVATPVSPTVAFPLGSRLDDPLAMYLADVYTLPASLAGVCAVSVPCALGRTSGLPVGLQLVAPALEEARLFAAAAAWEDVSPGRGLCPPVHAPAAPIVAP
ncbi:MAG: Asp-tRNA(Asn)/Glu-tRNA(Gln) amidotransferase subunit GatA [Polyangiaceae bacterium]|nr:Asp-tRNA(Asn)/Glu-tRNA(Gln) amidotransferase subunit GatA [Polyangiaceae bacterium]